MAKLILTYHASRLESLDRRGADVYALAADLAWLAEHRVPVMGLDALLDPAVEHGVAITFDDGIRLDGEGYAHPRFGELPSMLDVLRLFKPSLPELVATSFVIASPAARDALAEGLAADYGEDLMHSRWWRPAQRSGLIELGNHSFDHNHPLVPRTAQRDNARGGFLDIATEAEAEAEIAQASDLIEAACGFRPRHFAYPYGDVSPFLRDDWLPRRGPAIGLTAAFTTEPRALAKDDHRWALPRFVSGRDWNDSEGLAALVKESK